VPPQAISNVLSSEIKANPKILDREGLEAVTVYVRKNQGK
jgi:hypothetical protein